MHRHLILFKSFAITTYTGDCCIPFQDYKYLSYLSLSYHSQHDECMQSIVITFTEAGYLSSFHNRVK